LNFHQQALRVRDQRQQVLASNIANADTPNYKARDIDFKATLQAALGGSGAPGGVAVATTAPGHLAGKAGQSGDAGLLYARRRRAAWTVTRWTSMRACRLHRKRRAV